MPMGALIAEIPVRDDAGTRARRVAREVAAKHAGDVDARARFPQEAFEALRSEGLLGAMIPTRFGGEGLSLAEVADVCGALAGACGSTAMIYAMHQIKVSSFISHGTESEWHRAYMREIAARQLLLASATTEAGIGGDLRNSICAVETQGDRFRLTKEASVISYATAADAILVTARRAPDAASSDQVMVVVRKSDCALDRTSAWDTLGMRGTSSEGFKLVSEGSVQQIFPRAFGEIAAQSMLATSHILWSAVWFGIAAEALARAQNFLRADARRKPGAPSPGLVRLTEASAMLGDLKAGLMAAVERFERAAQSEDELSSMGFAVEMNNLKVTSSRLAGEVVQHALMITGIAGYKNDTPFSVGRQLRDVMSAPIMISNDRILLNTSNMLLVSRFNTSLVPAA